MSVQPLIVFDSGIGGFSILKELLPYQVPLLYYADQANFPYGEKSHTWLKERYTQLCSLFTTYQPRGVVVACNTGTVSGITLFRKLLSCPVFGVEPVTKMLSSHKHPVVWGTKVTTTSPQAQALRLAHGQHISYYTPVGLAAAIEAGDLQAINSILKELAQTHSSVDAIGLSCTHYPLITPIIQSYFPQAVLYDPSRSVATHVANTLKLKNSPRPLPHITYQSSLSVLRLKKQAKAYGL